MKMACLALAALLFTFLGLSCSTDRRGAEGGGLALHASTINKELESLRTELETIRDMTKKVLTSSQIGTVPSNGKYETFRGKMVYMCSPETDSCVFSTGFIAPGEKTNGKLDRLGVLTPTFVQARRKIPTIDLVWMVTKESMGITHPQFDLVTFLPVGMDMAKELVQFPQTGPTPNPSRGPVWFSPYIDMAGKGYVFTVAIPVYSGNTQEAVVAFDVSVKGFAAKHIKGLAGYYLLVDGSGMVVAATEQAKVELNLKVMGHYNYLELVRTRAPIPSDYLLSKHPDPSVRTLAEKAAGNRSGCCEEVAGKKFALRSAPIVETGWLLIDLDPAGC